MNTVRSQTCIENCEKFLPKYYTLTTLLVYSRSELQPPFLKTLISTSASETIDLNYRWMKFRLPLPKLLRAKGKRLGIAIQWFSFSFSKKCKPQTHRISRWFGRKRNWIEENSTERNVWPCNSSKFSNGDEKKYFNTCLENTRSVDLNTSILYKVYLWRTCYARTAKKKQNNLLRSKEDEAQSRYFEIVWLCTKLPLYWRKSENNTLMR